MTFSNQFNNHSCPTGETGKTKNYTTIKNIKTNIMKAICIDTQGEDSITKLAIVNVEDIDISSVSRMGKDIDISDPESGLLLNKQEILAKVRQLDIVVDNYCHGMYILLND